MTSASPSREGVAAAPPQGVGSAVAEWAAGLPAGGEGDAALLDMLEEANPVYAGRRAAEVTRLRAFVLYLLARRGLPPGTLPYVLEGLESGQDPYEVVVAAAAVREMKVLPEGIGGALIRALLRLRSRDAMVDLADFFQPSAVRHQTTAVTEILATLIHVAASDSTVAAKLADMAADESLGFSARWTERLATAAKEAGNSAAPSCCCEPSGNAVHRRRQGTRLPADILVEDQEGRSLLLTEWLSGRPALLVFFYTRCDNPEKCSATISRLAAVQEKLRQRNIQAEVRTAAITYDPGFDHPARMRAYGLNRGFYFSDEARFFRTAHGIDNLRAALQLGVNYTDAIVNGHRIEALFVDRNGRVAGGFERRAWSEDLAVEELLRLREDASLRWARQPALWLAGLGWTLPSLGLALFPKCPVCLAAWLSLFGVGSISFAETTGLWLKPILIVLVALHLMWLIRRGQLNNQKLPVLTGIGGATALVLGAFVPMMETALLPGVVAMAVASVLSNRGCECIQRLLRSEAISETKALAATR